MPSYFQRRKALQHAADVFLLGRGVEHIPVDGFNLSKRLFPFRHSISLLKHPESCVNIPKESVDQQKVISALGALSRTFSLPSVAGTSCQIFHYHAEHMLSESNQISSCYPVLRCLMSACSSFLHDAHLVAASGNNIATKDGLDFNFRMRVYHSGGNRSSECLKSATTFFSFWRPCKNMPNRCYWSRLKLLRFNLNQWVISRCQNSLPPGLFEKPVDSVYDVPLYGSINVEECQSSLTNTNPNLQLVSGSFYLPHPDKERTGGEDAHFICVDGHAIGVADGVGGWADFGVDAGIYARELMSHSVVAIQQEPRDSLDLLRVLEKAYSSTKARGSSTACIVALTNQGVHAINLGDSGFMVVRDGCTIFRSPVQQHDFNFTYQLDSENGSDLPSSAQEFAIPVAPGDVIVAGTDGLFDNLYDTDVTAIVDHAIREGLGPQITAQKIAALARQRAMDQNRQTPFSTAAQEAGYRYYGGKPDDITVVVSLVTASNA